MSNVDQTAEWTTEQLLQRLEGEDPFYVFDVREPDEFDSWKIEGRHKLDMVNVPYFEMLEFDEFDDVVDSFREYLTKRDWVEKLPKDRPVLAVCAQGDTSEHVAEAMRRMGFEAYNLLGGTQAWGDHYHVHKIEGAADPEIYQVSRPARGCLSYVVSRNGKAALIDPLRHVDKYLELIEDLGLEIELVLDTHGHADHISGGPELAKRTGAKYFLHPYDGIHPIDVLPAKIDYAYLFEGRTFDLAGSKIETLHIPGHTLGNLAFLIDGKYLFTGDSIFIESIARPDLGGRGDTWAPIHYHSLQRLLQLPDGTLILPAHFSGLGEESANGAFAETLGKLKAENQGLLMAQKSEQEFVDYILASLPKFPDEYVDIKRVNAGLLEVGEAKASELELGKNICALSQAYEHES